MFWAWINDGRRSRCRGCVPGLFAMVADTVYVFDFCFPVAIARKTSPLWRTSFWWPRFHKCGQHWPWREKFLQSSAAMSTCFCGLGKSAAFIGAEMVNWGIGRDTSLSLLIVV